MFVCGGRFFGLSQSFFSSLIDVFQRSHSDFVVGDHFYLVACFQVVVSEPRLWQDDGKACFSDSDDFSVLFLRHFFSPLFTQYSQGLIRLILYYCY